jgi:hypothetical protein
LLFITLVFLIIACCYVNKARKWAMIYINHILLIIFLHIT